MSKRVCLEPGCPTLTDRTRCTQHARKRDAARATSVARGYSYSHQRIRAGYQRRMNVGEMFHCWRCGTSIDPTAWQLGHDDCDRTQYRGPECIPCNTATAGRIPPRA